MLVWLKQGAVPGLTQAEALCLNLSRGLNGAFLAFLLPVCYFPPMPFLLSPSTPFYSASLFSILAIKYSRDS